MVISCRQPNEDPFMAEATVGARVLLAAYPRSGSTALGECLAALLGPDAGVVHEPFRQQPGRDRRDFSEGLHPVVETARLVKHHPGNLLSRRQNLMLYREWIANGGTIVHLVRHDREAQARSLLIARALNSYHRPHLVDTVPRARLEAEMGELTHEVDEQSGILAEVPHQSVSYEALFGGTLDSRLRSLDELLDRIDPAITYRAASPAARRRVRGLLDPGHRLSRDSTRTERVALIDQVPLMVSTSPWLSTPEAETLSAQLHEVVSGSTVGTGPHGVRFSWLREALSPAAFDSVDRQIRECLVHNSGLELTEDMELPLAVMVYDGDRYPDHDVGLFPTLPTSNRPALNISLTLGGTLPGSEAGVRLAGHGRMVTKPGELLHFSSSFGARREVVTAGSLICLVGSYGLEPSQILCAGQVFGDAGLFAGEGRDDRGDDVSS
jgi:hypothetical protein